MAIERDTQGDTPIDATTHGTKLIRLSGRGESATFLETDTNGGKRIIKTELRRDLFDVLERVTSLNNPKFPTLIDTEEIPGTEDKIKARLSYVEGQDFGALFGMDSEWILAQKPSNDEALKMVLELCKTYQELLQAGIFYLDLRPENIILQPDGNVGLIDFEHAVLKKKDESSWHCPVLDACWETAAPEEMTKEAYEQNEKGAVYRIGVIYTHLLLGRMPFKVNNDVLDEQARFDKTRAVKIERDFLQSIDEPLRGILSHSIHPQASKRLGTVQALVDLLGENR